MDYDITTTDARSPDNALHILRAFFKVRCKWFWGAKYCKTKKRIHHIILFFYGLSVESSAKSDAIVGAWYYFTTTDARSPGTHPSPYPLLVSWILVSRALVFLPFHAAGDITLTSPFSLVLWISVESSGSPQQIEELPYELPRTVFEIEEEHNRRDLLAHADLSRLFNTTLEEVARLPEVRCCKRIETALLRVATYG